MKSDSDTEELHTLETWDDNNYSQYLFLNCITLCFEIINTSNLINVKLVEFLIVVHAKLYKQVLSIFSSKS